MICFSFQNISTFLSPISMIVRASTPAALKPQWFQSERDHHHTNYNLKVFGNRTVYISVCISLHYFPFIRRFSWGMTTSGFSHLNTTVCNYACTCVVAFIRIIYSGRTKSTDSSLTSVQGHQWFFYFAHILPIGVNTVGATLLSTGTNVIGSRHMWHRWWVIV